jgi:cell division protein FtsL
MAGTVHPFNISRSLTEPVPATLDGDGDPPHHNGMNDRLTKLEAQYDTLKVVRPMTITVLGVLAAVFGLMITFLLTQSLKLESKMSSLETRIESKIDSSNAALRNELREEFRQMRNDINAQTSAVANAITATRQQAPQVLLVPTPVTPADKKN